MIYTCIKYPLPELVYIFCLQQFFCIFESTVHNNGWMLTTFMLNLGLSFFFKTLQIQVSQLLTWSGSTLFSSLLVNTCSLISDKNFWRNTMYSIQDSSVNYFLRNASHIYACTHPNPQFMVLAETSTFGIFRGRNVRGRNVRAETS